MRYPGGKGAAGVLQKIINEIPPCEVFIELFAGPGRIAKSLDASVEKICIEANPAVIAQYDTTAGITYIKCDAISWLSDPSSKKYTMRSSTVIYADPPYPLFTRKNEHRFYGKYELSDKQHEQLASQLSEVKALVLLSSYKNHIYDSILPRWRQEHFKAMTRHGVRTETLYLNFNKTMELADYKHLGNDFREREAIKRRVTNMIRKVKEMPEAERLLVFKELGLAGIAKKSEATGTKYYEYFPTHHGCEEHAKECAKRDTQIYGRKIYYNKEGKDWITHDKPKALPERTAKKSDKKKNKSEPKLTLKEVAETKKPKILEGVQGLCKHIYLGKEGVQHIVRNEYGVQRAIGDVHYFLKGKKSQICTQKMFNNLVWNKNKIYWGRTVSNDLIDIWLAPDES